MSWKECEIFKLFSKAPVMLCTFLKSRTMALALVWRTTNTTSIALSVSSSFVKQSKRPRENILIQIPRTDHTVQFNGPAHPCPQYNLTLKVYEFRCHSLTYKHWLIDRKKNHHRHQHTALPMMEWTFHLEMCAGISKSNIVFNFENRRKTRFFCCPKLGVKPDIINCQFDRNHIRSSLSNWGYVTL